MFPLRALNTEVLFIVVLKNVFGQFKPNFVIETNYFSRDEKT